MPYNNQSSAIVPYRNSSSNLTNTSNQYNNSSALIKRQPSTIQQVGNKPNYTNTPINTPITNSRTVVQGLNIGNYPDAPEYAGFPDMYASLPANAEPKKPFQTEDLNQYLTKVKRPSNAPPFPNYPKKPNVNTSYMTDLEKGVGENASKLNNPLRRLGNLLRTKLW
jgi:hypothetical protein